MQVTAARHQIIRDFNKQYRLNDTAHRVKHFAEVEKVALIMNARLNLNQSPMLIMLAAYFHDLFAWSRHNHELLSAAWMHTSDYPLLISYDEDIRVELSNACYEHRASYKGEFSSVLSELISSADRGMPKSKECLFERSYEYHRSRDHSHEESVHNAIEHIKDKHGSDGYARYPDLYLKFYGEQIKQIKLEIDKL
jgi:hypothetical protein